MEEPIVFTLKNGIRVIHQHLNREVAHCGLMIGSGSRDEMPNEHGLAHFLEHCFFKGTKKRKTHHILSRLDSVGGELNAFTAKEETWIHASYLKEHFERSIELLADIAFQATFPANEIEKEKEVIVDEINSYKDSPADMIFEEFDEIIFGTDAMGRSILGTEKSLASFKTSHLSAFRKRTFTPQNMIFSSAGNISLGKLKDLLEKYIGSHKLAKDIPRVKVKYKYKPQNRTVVRDIHQVHYMMGTLAYDFDNKKRPALYLINNLLGGPAMNSRLNMNIREKHGIAYSIDSNYAPFSDTGVFSIYLGTEKENLNKSIDLIWKELKKLKDAPLSTRQLHDTKKQMIGQIAIAQDSGSALMFNNAKSLMMFNHIEPMTEVYKKIETLQASELLDVANEMFDLNRMSSIVYTHK
jgi:predicted Zn-dependent peptidase